MSSPSKTPMCRKFERDLYHFQAGELPEGEQRALAGHVEACPPCARLLDVENEMLAALKRRINREEAPPDLRVRVRETLERQSARRPWVAWLKAPGLVPVAAALLLAAVLLPALPRMAGIMHVEREVVVVDIDCELMGKTLPQQRQCTHPHHLNALKVDSERYWNIGLEDDTGRRLAADRGMRGHRLRVVGDLYTRIRTLQITRFVEDSASLSVGTGETLPAAFPFEVHP